MIGVILAAGDGTRLKQSAGEESCKALTKVRGSCLIEFALSNLKELGIPEACIVVGKHGDRIRETIGTEYRGIRIHYVHQKQRKGLMHAFVQSLETVGDRNVVLQLADEIFLNLNTRQILLRMDGGQADFYCGITYEQNPEKIRQNYSLETGESDRIRDCWEKPAVVTNNMKGTGFCFFRRSALEVLRQSYSDADNTPRELCDYIRLLLDRGQQGCVVQVAEKEFNINTLADLEDYLSQVPG